MILLLIFIGFLVGTFGTLIGAGGGFILMPVLLLLYPHDKPESLTAISLAVVFFNALSGSIAYAIKGKIHWRSAIIFSIASAPGAILGAYATRFFPREKFEMTFGILMLVMALYLVFPRKKKTEFHNSNSTKFPVWRMTGRDEVEHVISYNPKAGILISLGVGFISSLLGIGGGIIHVPALVNVLNFPVHIATATSHAVLAFMAAIGTGEHIATGAFDGSSDRVIALAPGVMIGAQVGAYLSNKVNETWIIRALSICLLSVAVRFIFF